MKESSLYPLVKNFLDERGYEAIINALYGKYSPLQIDVIALNKRSLEVLSVEVKVNKFQRALQQGLQRMLFSDYVVLAFPEVYANHVNQHFSKVLEIYGIGLYSINGNVKEILMPKRSSLIIPSLKLKLIKNIWG
ncbi:MAG: hypothetical protein QXZ28_01945 [Candidatus Methanomethylicaceae archaeon]